MNTTLPPENIYTPNQTLYINNLNEKIKPEETKVSLYFLCSQYGEILEIITKKSDKMRGQAFVVFKDLTAATNAMRALQGFVFFENPLRINYAKEKSDVVSKLEGTYVTKPKGVKKEKGDPTKKVKTDETERKDRTQPQQPRAPKVKDAGAPNNILFVENLPENCTDEALTPLFKQFPGLKDVRVIGSKQVAFIEYGDEIQAGMAMSGLSGFYLTKDNALVISYAKQ